MTEPTDRADDRLRAWATATDRPVPAFAARVTRRGGLSRVVALATVMVLVLVALVAGVVLTGGGSRKASLDTAPSAELAMGAAQAIATTPGVHYTLTVAVSDGGINQVLRSSGDIDFAGDRFAGTADAGPDGQTMLMFGGPASGAVIKAGGMFVQTENGPWVPVPPNPQFDALTNRTVLSRAFVRALSVSEVDPAIRTAPCGSTTCRLVSVAIPKAAFFVLEQAVFGDAISEPPVDLAPIVIDVLIDPATGSLAGLETQTTAGTTSSHIQLALTKPATVLEISPPTP
jgi:hypothetical protein